MRLVHAGIRAAIGSGLRHCFSFPRVLRRFCIKGAVVFDFGVLETRLVFICNSVFKFRYLLPVLEEFIIFLVLSSRLIDCGLDLRDSISSLSVWGSVKIVVAVPKSCWHLWKLLNVILGVDEDSITRVAALVLESHLLILEYRLTVSCSIVILSVVILIFLSNLTVTGHYSSVNLRTLELVEFV
jgi:hypothetical protein